MLTPKNQRRLISVGLILIICIIFSLTSDSFLASKNILLILKECGYAGLVALGASFVMVGGGVDLSAAGVICVCGVVAARVSLIPGMPGIVVVLVTILAGLACGAVNGGLITKLHLTEFVTTLATGSVFSGLAYMTTFRQNGRVYSQVLSNKSFLIWGKGIGGLYYISIAWIILVIVFQFIFTKTKFGTHVTAQGSNAKSAAMSGVKNDLIKFVSYVIDGGCCGLAAAFTVAYQTATNQALGQGMDFQAVACCCVGGIVLGGGKGDALSTCFGALFMVIISNGLYKLGLSTGETTLFQGIVIIAIINFDMIFGRFTENRLRVKAEKAISGGA